jgi:hypothetical protein
MFTSKHTPVVTSVRGIGNHRSRINTAGTVDGLHNVLHMPNASQPVISVGAFLDQIGGELRFTASKCYMWIKGRSILVAKRDERGLYRTCMSKREANQLAEGTAKVNVSIQAQVLREQIHTLHRSLGHCGRKRMLQVLKRNSFTNLKPEHLKLLTSCDACHSGKIKKAKRPKKSSKRAKTFGHTITTDSTCKQKIRTKTHMRYANVAVDEATRWSFVALLKKIKHTKRVALDPLLRSKLKGLTRTLRTDLGKEFDNGEVKRLCIQLGIKQEAACADDQHQNGLSERTIGVLFEIVRTMMADSRLPLSFWGEALICANYIRNLLPTAGNKFGMSPYEARYGKLPNLKGLRPFGSRCTVLKHSRTFDAQNSRQRGLKGIMVGYGQPYGKKGYRFFIPSLKKVVTAPNVLFVDSMEESIARRPELLIETRSPDELWPFEAGPENSRSGSDG